MSKKCQKPAHNTPTKASEKRTKENQLSMCPMCDAVIADVAGDDAVYCEGICTTWFHRKCVSMSKAVYDKLGEPDYKDPYLCPNCMINKQSNEITELKILVKTLTAILKALESKVTESENKLSNIGKSTSTLSEVSVNTVPTPVPSDTTLLNDQHSTAGKYKIKPISAPLHGS